MTLHTTNDLDESTNDPDESTADSNTDEHAFDRTLCAIVDALSEAEGTTPEDLSPPLFSVVDVDALERLLDRGEQVIVQFRYNDHLVTVDDNGSIVVHSTSNDDDGDGGGDGSGGDDGGGPAPGDAVENGDGRGDGPARSCRPRVDGDEGDVDRARNVIRTGDDRGEDGDDRRSRSSLRDVPVLPLAPIH